MPTAVISKKCRKIFLTGFMGSGKSTAGPLLARLTGTSFIDLDSRIVEYAGKSIASIFADSGEDFFRDIETQTLQRVCQADGSGVIATGGGIVERSENITLMKKHGCMIYLSIPLSTIWERISDDSARPLVRRGFDETQKLYINRQKKYQEADYTVDCLDKSPLEIVEDINDWIKSLI